MPPLVLAALFTAFLCWQANRIGRAIGVTLPTTTVINKTLYVGFLYNSTDSKWDGVLVRQEA